MASADCFASARPSRVRQAAPARRDDVAIVVAGRCVWLRCGPLPPGLLDERSRGRRRSSSIGTASRCTRRDRRSGLRSETISTPTRCRRRWSPATLAAEDVRFRLAPRASIRSRSCARSVATSARAARRRRRIDDHAAGREAAARAADPVRRPRARLAREAPRSRRRAAARASADEGRDPRALSEPRAVRQSD